MCGFQLIDKRKFSKKCEKKKEEKQNFFNSVDYKL